MLFHLKKHETFIVIERIFAKLLIKPFDVGFRIT